MSRRSRARRVARSGVPGPAEVARLEARIARLEAASLGALLGAQRAVLDCPHVSEAAKVVGMADLLAWYDAPDAPPAAAVPGLTPAATAAARAEFAAHFELADAGR